MKNRAVNDIIDFKSRMKKLYEYKIHDLKLDQVEEVYQVQEDEQNQQTSPEPQKSVDPPQAIQKPEPQPVQNTQPKPIQQPPVTPTPPIAQPQISNNEDNSMMSFIKSELQKLEGVVSAIQDISMNVDKVSQRLDVLTKSVDEIREPSDIEKLEMRAFDSYPYNKTLDKVWGDKMKSKEEQDMERMGIQKTENGFEMEYTPQRNFNHNQSTNNFNNF